MIDIIKIIIYNSISLKHFTERGEMMRNNKKAVLCALNAKYVHTALSVRYIKAYADKYCTKVSCEIVEETVNTNSSLIAQTILSQNPDIVAFSCYIWNINNVIEICKIIKMQSPDTSIILGGPEVSYNPHDYLENDYVDYVQCGEGERPMSVLLDCIASDYDIPADIGVCYKKDGEIICSAPYCEKNLSDIESPYTDEYVRAVKGRIAYIETTRGCPFSCAFCLSGAQRGVRYFEEEYVKESIIKLWKSGAHTVKFIDRTFNINEHHANGIISFILDNKDKMPDDVCFHFEIAADILAQSTIELLTSAPAGLFQIEAGLQSFNHETLEAVCRKTDNQKVCENVKKITQSGNIHIHIDLIAGLPYENLESFKDSFNKAYLVGADMLQLGFLKLLYGSRLRAQAQEYGFEYSDKAPYEIISTNWLSASEMLVIKDAEDANEKISNSGRFKNTLEYVLEVSGKAPFDLFCEFGKKASMPLDEYTRLVFEYFGGVQGVEKARLRDLMCIDRLRTNRSGKLPECLKIKDASLAKVTAKLQSNPKTKLQSGVKRAVCILYTENKAVYVDYQEDDNRRSNEYKLNYVDIDELFVQE